MDTSLFGKLKPAQVYSLKINKQTGFDTLEGKTERGLRPQNRKLTVLFFSLPFNPDYHGVKPIDLKGTAAEVCRKKVGINLHSWAFC